MALCTLPLFPLRTVIFPYGRIPLQVFEPRYMQLAKQCIRDQSPFGIVRIEQGSEVRTDVDAVMPRIASIGTRVELVDWFSLEHGMLGIVVEGQDCFRVDKTWPAADGLLMADIAPVPLVTAVLDDNDQSLLLSLWQDLRRHPQLQELGYPRLPESDTALLGSLLQVLPMPEEERYPLLADFGSPGSMGSLRRWLQEQGVA